MESSNHSELATQKAFVDNICAGFASELERRSNLLELAFDFHKPAEAVSYLYK